jgi:hypothetical protein
MKGTLKKIREYFTIKNVSYASLILNLTSIILGIIYLAIPIYSILWDVFGVILMINLFNNFLLVYLTSICLNKTTKLGNKINYYCYVYLIFAIFAMLFMALGNFLIAIIYENVSFITIILYFIVFFGYFGFFGFGGLIAYVDVKNLDNRELWDVSAKGSYNPTKRTLLAKKIFKVLLGLICLLLLLIGVLLAYSYLFPNFITGVVVPEFSVFFGIISLSVTVILLKMFNKKRSPKRFYAVGLIGLVSTGIMIVPLFLTPWTIYNAEVNFAEAFGADWRDKIPTDVEATYFLQSQFWIPGYFLGIPAKDCEVRYDITYFDGSISNYSVDKDITLKFDVYWPKGDRTSLPGESSIMIWIHGGSWRYGGKGNYRVIYNKYFAAQGYVVYDIQYGLHREAGGLDLLGLISPKEVFGDFNISDMVRHIGNFTQYISKASNKYSASELGGNLSSVFIHGGSAGGHLTVASALTIWSNNYTNLFGSSINIKGYVPYYPANGLSGLPGPLEFKLPENYFINSTTPPALIYQGTSDISCGKVSQRIKDRYTSAGNDKCAIIWFPLAGHANDIYFSGYYNVPFIYYMERFLYLVVNDLI